MNAPVGARGASRPGGRHPRWMWITGGVVLALVVLIGICEAAGWPFLVEPLQSRLSQALDRRIVIAGGEQNERKARIGLLGSVRLQAPTIEIGAPAWSDAPHMLLAHDAQLRLGYVDLWRAYRGGPLHIRELRAADLDARVQRLADGRASWQFGEPKTQTDADPVQDMPTFGDLRVGDGRLVYRDAILEADVDARFALREGSGPAAASTAASGGASAPPAGSAAGGSQRAGLELQATGRYQGMPLKVELRTTGVLDLVGPDAAGVTQPVLLNAVVGRAKVHFKGTAADPLRLAGLRGRFEVEGPSLASIGDPLGVTLPTTGPFKTHGTLLKEGDVWNAEFAEALIVDSRLNGSFKLDRGKPRPLLTGRLGGSRLVLADLGPAVGAAASDGQQAKADAKNGKVLPDRRFDLPALRAMDADVAVELASADLGTPLLEALKPLRGHLRLQDGVLTLTDLDARTADGRLAGSVQLDGRNAQALWNADLRLSGLRLERWLRQGRGEKAPPYISGRLYAETKVSGQGRSTAEILGSLDGTFRFHIRNAALSELAVEAAGIDAAEALGVLVKGDEALRIQCNVADFVIKEGIVRPRVFIIDTVDSTIWIDGALSLRTENLDLTAIVSPKDFSVLTLRTPVHVTGKLSSPSVSLDKGQIAGKVGAAALLALVNPIAALLPFIDPGDSEEAKREAAKCAEVTQRRDRPAGAAQRPASRSR